MSRRLESRMASRHRWREARGLQVACAALGLVVMTGSPVHAQRVSSVGSRATAIDTVIGANDFFVEDRPWDTQVIVDTFASTELAPGVQLTVRPVFWRVGGGWETLVEHLSLRYEFTMLSNWRVEAGRFPSPMGFGMTENRGNVNSGVIWCHRPYYTPVPSLGANVPRLSLVSAVYPTGVQVGTSGDHWDARAALVDRAPIDFWKAEDGSAHQANTIVGAGITPRQGVRVGASAAWGKAAGTGPQVVDTRYRMFNVEGEYAFGHTRLSGEVTRDTLDLPGSEQTLSGWTLQARQTLTPRVFVHGRVSNMRSPAALGDGTFSSRTFRSIDSTVGYLVSPELTLRVAHTAVDGWGGNDFDHQIGLSIVWARRWW